MSWRWPATCSTGRLARRLGQVTEFGGYADSLADAAFWPWFAARHEQSRALRVTAIAAWVAPAVAVAATSLARGKMTDTPRPVLVRPAAALQAVLTVRALWPPQRSRHQHEP